jgi:ClpP class serine protease
MQDDYANLHEFCGDSNRLRRVMDAVFSQPWAIRPAFLDVVCDVVQDAAARRERPYEFQPKAQEHPGNQVTVEQGIAKVVLDGVIINHASSLLQVSGAISPQAFARDYSTAMAMPDVTTVALLVNSPGGHVAGVKEAADLVWQLKQGNPRPVIAFIDGQGASAAYWIASQADEIWATPTSLVGSIGVVTKITDRSRREKNEGADSFILRTGPNKATGMGPVSESQIAVAREIQDGYFAMFQEALARRSAPLPPDALTGREYLAPSVVGTLVDRIGTWPELLHEYGTDAMRRMS